VTAWAPGACPGATGATYPVVPRCVVTACTERGSSRQLNWQSSERGPWAACGQGRCRRQPGLWKSQRRASLTVWRWPECAAPRAGEKSKSMFERARGERQLAPPIAQGRPATRGRRRSRPGPPPREDRPRGDPQGHDALRGGEFCGAARSPKSRRGSRPRRRELQLPGSAGRNAARTEPSTRRPRTAAGRCRLTGSFLPHRSRAWSCFETGKSAETSPSRPQRPMATGMHLEGTGHGGRARQGEAPDPTSPRRSCPSSRTSVVSSGT
jgi:hypothetical protein